MSQEAIFVKAGAIEIKYKLFYIFLDAVYFHYYHTHSFRGDNFKLEICVMVFLFLHKNICCGYQLEVPQ